MPRILVAIDAFKGAVDAATAASAIGEGVAAAWPDAEVDLMPLADGGEGTLDVLADALGGRRCAATVTSPSGAPCRAEWLLTQDKTIVIEAARVVGWRASSEETAAEGTAAEETAANGTTYGLGELIQAAIDDTPSARRIWLGLGGSATVDGGIGLLMALGARAEDAAGRSITPTGLGLGELVLLDLEPARARLRGLELRALCDVTSPLLGPRGARLYMAQKGADPQTANILENNLARYADIAESASGVQAAQLSGAGAAGGLGAAVALLHGRLGPGADVVLDALDADARIAACHLVIGGEGRVDTQTAEGKAMVALGRRAQAHGRPLVLLCGARGDGLGAVHAAGITAVFTIGATPRALHDALDHTEEDLRSTAQELARLFRQMRTTSSPAP